MLSSPNNSLHLTRGAGAPLAGELKRQGASHVLAMAKDIRICFVGDSFVNGTGDETALGWVGRLCADTHARGTPVTYYNLGIRRNTSKDILRRWEAECSLRLPDTCDGRLVLSCGVNDTVIENGSVRVTPEESRANVREILRGASKYKVLMCGPPPVSEDEQNERIMALSQVLAHEARVLGVPYIDLFSPLITDAEYKREVSSNDGSHPRSSGYAKMANIVLSSINWWFNAPKPAGYGERQLSGVWPDYGFMHMPGAMDELPKVEVAQ